ncbi:MAG: hypothetical protein CMH61_01550 [Nanoarchaeota archaeon]|nr:hypothetical protein [Nanoarchaeota archaeon]|tara:strand:+ start:13807 stop:14529 length:723 start_codon:yes stop_codon:yes gene_type:complete
MLEDVLKNPEKYRDGENYHATNIVFPVKWGDDRYIVKQPNLWSTVADAYYGLQDEFFYGRRHLSTAKQRIAREADVLARLQGNHAPLLVDYKGKTLVREYIKGKQIKDHELEYQKLALALALAVDSLKEIHEKGIVIGDAHMKNVIIRRSEAYWVGFNVIPQIDPLSQSVDILKMVYSTFTLTRDAQLTLYAAERVAAQKNWPAVVGVKYLIAKDLSTARLWFPTRVSRKVNKEIKKILK